jgi:sugar lactone lactonase YvrE
VSVRRLLTVLLLLAFVGATATGAYAWMDASVSPSMNFGTAAQFNQTPSCRWTDHAQVTLTWNADPDATSYDILRSTAPGAGYASIGNVGAAVTSYADDTVNPDPEPVGHYYYKLQVNTAGAPKIGHYADSTTCPGYLTTDTGGAGVTAPALQTPQQPRSIAVSGSTMYVAESKLIMRSIDLNTNQESVVAGAQTPGYYGDGGPAHLANLGQLGGVAVDADGNQYVADISLNIVRKISVGGEITLFAGTPGTPCNNPVAACGDGGLATSAQLKAPIGLATDSSGNVYIVDRDDERVRMVSAADGKISTFAGDGTTCSTPTDACGDGGNATSAQLNTPAGLAVDEHDNVYIADEGDRRVREVTASDGKIQTFAGTGHLNNGDWDTTVTATAMVAGPQGLWADGSGAVYVASQANMIRKVDGATTTRITGTSGAVNADDGGRAVDAQVRSPDGVVGDSAGRVFVAATRSVRVILPDGTIGTYAGTGGSCTPSTAPCGDGGLAQDATFSAISGLALDDVGNLYVSDRASNRIRKISPSGYVSTFAGTGDACASPTDACGDGGPATAAS